MMSSLLVDCGGEVMSEVCSVVVWWREEAGVCVCVCMCEEGRGREGGNKS